MGVLSQFCHEQFGELRALNQDGEPWFLAKDICNSLDIRTNSIRSILDGDEIRSINDNSIVIASGGRDPLIVSESGFFALVLRSRKKKAKAFRKWVTSEVLPSIRKSGGYQVQHAIPQTLPDALRLAADIAEERDALQLENADMKPKAEFHDRVTQSEDEISVAEAAQMAGYGQNRFFRILRDRRILIPSGTRRNLPYQKFLDREYFTVKESTYEAKGETRITTTTKVTQKGLEWLLREFGAEAAA